MLPAQPKNPVLVGFAIQYTKTGKFWGKDERGHWIVSDTPYVFPLWGSTKKEQLREDSDTVIVDVYVDL